MEENNKIKVTVAWEGRPTISLEDKAVFVVGLEQGIFATHCSAEDILKLAVHTLAEVKSRIVPELLKTCRPEISAEKIFDEILAIAADYEPETNAAATEHARRVAGIL